MGEALKKNGASLRPSVASATFDESIKDAEQLLAHCESLGNPLPKNAEVYKRAGLVMALTAWETYVEDRVREVVATLIPHATRSDEFMRSRLDGDLKRFHTPNTERTQKIFEDYAGVNVTLEWHWNGFDIAKTCSRLDELVKKRGDAVHRSKSSSMGTSQVHLVRKEDLVKAIRFFKELVAATERSLAKPAAAQTPS